MDYTELFIQSPLFKQSPFTVLSVAFLIVARMLPIIALAPFFGAKLLPHPVKVTLALCLLIMIAPQVFNKITEPLPFNATLLLLAAKELFIGTILGFFISLPFLILSSSGVLIDHQRGAASLMTNDPTIQNQSSPIGQLFNLVLIVLFFQLDGPFIVIDTLFTSYDLFPPDKFLNPLFFLPNNPVHEKIMNSMQAFVILMLQFAMPGLLVILMTDTFLGIANRLAPQVQITFLGMGLKAWLAILIIFLGWAPFVDQMGKQVIIWLRQFMNLIVDLSHSQSDILR